MARVGAQRPRRCVHNTANMVEKLIAAAILLACLVAMARLLMKDRQRARLDAALQRTWQRCRRAAQRLRRGPKPAPDAAQLTEELIRRAREGHWEGNVYKPRSFRKPKKPH